MQISWLLSLRVNYQSISHPPTRRRSNVVTASLCTSQQHRRYTSNETPNNVSVERRQDVSVVRLHNILLVCCGDVSWGCNDDVPSVRLHDVSNRSQIKHPMTSQFPNETPNNIAVVRFHHVLELRCRDVLSLVPSLLRFQITLSSPPSRRFSLLI